MSKTWLDIIESADDVGELVRVKKVAEFGDDEGDGGASSIMVEFAGRGDDNNVDLGEDYGEENEEESKKSEVVREKGS